MAGHSTPGWNLDRRTRIERAHHHAGARWHRSKVEAQIVEEIAATGVAPVEEVVSFPVWYVGQRHVFSLSEVDVTARSSDSERNAERERAVARKINAQDTDPCPERLFRADSLDARFLSSKQRAVECQYRSPVYRGRWVHYKRVGRVSRLRSLAELILSWRTGIMRAHG